MRLFRSSIVSLIVIGTLPVVTAGGQERIPKTPTELSCDLQPTSVTFRPGHRIRVTITEADRNNNPVPGGAPTIRLYRNAQHASRVVLPISPAPRPR